MDKAFDRYSPDTLRVLGIAMLALAGLTIAFVLIGALAASDGGWPVWIGGVAIPVALLGWLTLRAGSRSAGRASTDA